MIHQPDYWQVIKIQTPDEGPIFKVFATWVGGYTQGDAWKLNSGITEVRFNEPPYIEFVGYSGSSYIVTNDEACYRTTAWTGSVLANIINKSECEVEILPFNTKWSKILKNK